MAFGYTHEDLRLLLGPMATAGEEPVGSMGTDTALAVLSNRPRLLYDYFKQLFAQVTNPPLDGIREELVTQIATTIGPEGNLLEPTPEAARQLKLKTPILNNEEVARIRHSDVPHYRSTTIQMVYPAAGGGAALGRRARGRLPPGEPGGEGRLHLPDPLRPRGERAARAHPLACSPPRACTTT